MAKTVLHEIAPHVDPQALAGFRRNFVFTFPHAQQKRTFTSFMTSPPCGGDKPEPSKLNAKLERGLVLIKPYCSEPSIPMRTRIMLSLPFRVTS